MAQNFINVDKPTPRLIVLQKNMPFPTALSVELLHKLYQRYPTFFYVFLPLTATDQPRHTLQHQLPFQEGALSVLRNCYDID